MSSIIQGYNYDIFISYRQKDNKGDHWVSGFVEALRTELESTFKEEISVYFDINPHDGLLETHDVNASLNEKLKCLIFIPIISRTYCDPKSYAWEHEFKAFVEMASKDAFGLKVKLSNGNVAMRVLPVNIHELDGKDIKLCESLLGGVLRGIDFVYKAAGVNRPLRASEDHPQDNLCKTYYRDQINKVANAIKEIIFAFSAGKDAGINNADSERKAFNILKYGSSSLTKKRLIRVFERMTYPARSKLIALVILSILLGIVGIWGWLKNPSVPATYSTLQFDYLLSDKGSLTAMFAISPDGRTVATTSRSGIHLKSLSSFSNTLLPETEGAQYLSFSPNGQSLAYLRGNELYKISLIDYAVTNLNTGIRGFGFSWGHDDNIYFSAGVEGIWRVSSKGGKAEQVTSVIDSLGEREHSWPQLLPDSRTILYNVTLLSGELNVVIHQTGPRGKKIRVENAVSGRYLSNGKILYSDVDGNLFTVPLNLRDLKITGKPEAVLQGVNTSSYAGAPFYSVSETGNLIYLPKQSVTLTTVDVLDRTGEVIVSDSIPAMTLELLGKGWYNLSVSPNGNFFACTGRSSENPGDIWIVNLVTGYPQRITFEPNVEEYPVWSPSSDAIAYSSSLPEGGSTRIIIKDLHSSASPTIVRKWPGHFMLTSWSHDGKWLAGWHESKENGNDSYAISVSSGDSIPVSTDKVNENRITFSPDGKWVTYDTSDKNGHSLGIYALSFPDLRIKKQIAFKGGVPKWDRSGKYIYYFFNSSLWAQPVDLTSPDLITGKPVRLFPANASNFGFSPDGNKFYLQRLGEKVPAQYLNLITNWY